ncbi:MAG TPA: P63C domain-containing protein [Tepidisphaeraceae bacterium]|jgi:hypothetical protein|nr:P63C domain-containing protein [Tepidisphaeraceae bacterium]
MKIIENPTETTEIASPQSLGGKARAEKTPATERKAQAKRAAKARWEAAIAAAKELQDPNRMPEALCEGVMEIGSVEIECYVLDTLKRVIHKRGMAKALGMKSGGGNVFMRAMQRKGLGSEIGEDLRKKLDNPIIFKPLASDLGHGYDATILIDICSAIIDASKAGKLGPGQEGLAIQAEIIIRASAKLGIVALVDDATGFIADKRREKYKELFREFIREEIKLYDEPQFPDQLFDVIYKIYGLPRKADAKNHPQFFGWFIRKYIYEPLANSNGAILEMLDGKNPVVYVNGGRRYKLYNFLSEVVGMPALKAQLWQVVGIGNSVKNKAQYERSFYTAFPRPQLELFDNYDLD